MTTGLLIWIVLSTIAAMCQFIGLHLLATRITALEAKRRPRKPKVAVTATGGSSITPPMHDNVL